MKELPEGPPSSTFVMHGRRSTIARISTLASDGTVLLGVGDALLHPDDHHYDPLVGSDLALGRALESIGRRLQRRAEGRMRMLEHNHAHSRKSQEPPRDPRTPGPKLLDRIANVFSGVRFLGSKTVHYVDDPDGAMTKCSLPLDPPREPGMPHGRHTEVGRYRYIGNGHAKPHEEAVVNGSTAPVFRTCKNCERR